MNQQSLQLSRAAARRHTADMTGKTIVITGATAGVGKETARSLAKMGGNIIIAARNQDKARRTIEAIRNNLGSSAVKLEHRSLDLTDLDSIREFASSFASDDPLDVLINNAGVGHDTGVTKQGIERTFGINYLGHFLLTKLLLPPLARSRGRIVHVSSMGHMGAKHKYFDMPYKGPCTQMKPQQRYGRSKAAQVLFSKALQRRFNQTSILCTSVSLHPGGVRTKILDNQTAGSAAVLFMLRPFLVDPPEGARTSVYLATRDRPAEIAGKYFHYGLFFKGIYEKPGTALVNDEALQERLWKISEDLIGEEFLVG